MLDNLLNLLRRPSDSACSPAVGRPTSGSAWQPIGKTDAVVPPQGEELDLAEQPDWRAIDFLFAAAGSRADWRSAMQE